MDNANIYQLRLEAIEKLRAKHIGGNTMIPRILRQCRHLNRNKVEYMVVGGFAMGLHGLPRLTMDLDLYVNPTIENATKIVKSIDEMGYVIDCNPAQLILKEFVLVGEKPLRIDFLNAISISGDKSTETFYSMYKNKVSISIEGLLIDVIGLDDLIRNKQGCRRLKDNEDYRNLAEHFSSEKINN